MQKGQDGPSAVQYETSCTPRWHGWPQLWRSTWKFHRCFSDRWKWSVNASTLMDLECWTKSSAPWCLGPISGAMNTVLQMIRISVSRLWFFVVDPLREMFWVWPGISCVTSENSLDLVIFPSRCQRWAYPPVVMWCSMNLVVVVKERCKGEKLIL